VGRAEKSPPKKRQKISKERPAPKCQKIHPEAGKPNTIRRTRRRGARENRWTNQRSASTESPKQAKGGKAKGEKCEAGASKAGEPNLYHRVKATKRPNRAKKTAHCLPRKDRRCGGAPGGQERWRRDGRALNKGQGKTPQARTDQKAEANLQQHRQVPTRPRAKPKRKKGRGKESTGASQRESAGQESAPAATKSPHEQKTANSRRGRKNEAETVHPEATTAGAPSKQKSTSQKSHQDTRLRKVAPPTIKQGNGRRKRMRVGHQSARESSKQGQPAIRSQPHRTKRPRRSRPNP